MTIEARLADGTVLNFPEGTDPAVIQRVVRERVSGGQSGQRAAVGDTDRSVSEVATDFFQRAGDMVPFADEVRSAGYAVQDIATGGGLDGAWERARARDAGASEDAERRQGSIERLASDTLGLGTSILAPMGAARSLGVALPTASTGLGRVTQAAGTGGVAGGVVGFGEGDTLQERSQNALGGMAFGTVAGAGIGGAVEGVSGLARGVGRAMPRGTMRDGVTPVNARQSALRRVARRLDDDGLTAEQARGRLDQMRRDGVSGSLLETGNSTRGLARAVRDTPGTATGLSSGRRLDDFVENRLQDAPRAIRDRADDALVPGRFRLTPPSQVEGQYRKAVRQQTGPLYQRVTGSVPGQNQTLRTVFNTPAGRQAVRRAQTMVRNDPDLIRAGVRFPDVFDDAGKVLDDLPDIDIRALHYMRYAFDDIANMGSRTGATRGTYGPGQLRGMLDRIMKAANPAIRQADELHSTLMDGIKGMPIGREFDRMSAAQLRNWMQNATAPQRALARITAANRFGGRIQDMADATTQLRPGGNRLQAIRAMFGSEEAADDFARHIAAQREIAASRQAVTGGSQTSYNLAQADGEAMQMLAELGADFASGGAGILSALRQSAARIIRRLPGGMGANERRILIDMLTETDPQKLAVIFGDIAEQQGRTASRQAVQGAAANTAAASTAIMAQPSL
jgi:hypothetical protein